MERKQYCKSLIGKTVLDKCMPMVKKVDVRRSIPWTQDEIDSLMGYEWADDSETLDERLDHARYMNHYESGCNFPNRSLSAVRKKFYEECKKRKAV